MDKNVKKENKEKFNEAALKAGKLFDGQKGNVETKDLQEIADEFEVDVEELFAEAEYDYKVWKATLKANKILGDIAVEFEIDPEDLEIGLEEYWKSGREQFDLAVKKFIELLEWKKGDITDEEIQEIVEKFGVEKDELIKAIEEIIIGVEPENEEQ